MIKLTTAIIFCTLAVASRALDPGNFCQENFTLADFPEGILKETLSILILGTVVGFRGCPGNVSVPPGDVNLWYYSRNNPTNPILLDKTNPTQIDPNKKTIVLAPGWLCNVTNDGMPVLRESYLKRYDANIIGIDWTKHSIALYTESFCSVAGVAQIVADFLCRISGSLGIDLSGVHMVGHSMGGQISGLTGQEVQKQCNKKLGRITGLDPAGPLFQTLSKSKRLDASDATQVDVIHTNMGFFGFWGHCGTVDFYPNCGTFQAGCLKVDRNTSISDIINLPLTVVNCNHLRALDYMNESISSNAFNGKSCKGCPGFPIAGPCITDILWPSRAVMGEDCPSDPKDGKYTLETNRKAPYAKG